jgi:putative ABC transport system substrate-binding protein
MTIGRREFITLLGGAAAAWPITAFAQSATVPVIGFLNLTSPTAWAPYLAAFKAGLKETGYVESQSVAIEYRWANGQAGDLSALAADLVRRQVNVIVTNGPTATLVKAATTSIPIVFYSGADPVSSGLVTSLNHPDGNLTGVTNLNRELLPKRLEVLHELMPTASIAVLLNPNGRAPSEQTKLVDLAAKTFGMKPVEVVHASNDSQIDVAFAHMAEMSAGGLAIANDVFLISRSQRLAALAERYSLPAIYQAREFVAAGGLMSYGPSDTEAWRQVGIYTGRVLRGEKPADLPVQQGTRVELIINLKTAKALGLTMPITLLARADEVIE